MGENVGRGLHHVGAQVHHLAQLDPAAQVRLFGIGGGHTFVQAFVVQLFEVFRADVIVERVPAVHEVGEVPEPKIEESQKGHHPRHPDDNSAQAELEVGHAQPGEATLPPQEHRAQHGEDHLPTSAGVVVPVVEVGLGSGGGGRVHHFHLGRKWGGRLAVGGDLGDRVEAVAFALAHAQEARGHAAHIKGTHAQPVPGGRVDLPHHFVFLAVERSPDVVGVVGVGLDGEMAHAHHLAQIPGHDRGAGFKDGGQGCVPHRAFGRQGLVGEQAEVALDLLPLHGRLASQQVARRTGRHRRGAFLRPGLRLGKSREDQKRQQGTSDAWHGEAV